MQVALHLQPFAAGMALQLERLERARREGMPRRGWKIGINVPEVQQRLGLSHPGVGWIDGRHVYPSGAAFPVTAGARPHLEPEIAIRIARAVPPDASLEEARACIDAVHPALEVVDYARPGSSLDEVVAHCMFHAGTVLGDPAPPDAARALGGDRPRLLAGARAADPPRADLVPGDLAELVRFVARYLDAFGQTLDPGDLVLSGSYTARALAIGPGDESVADFGAPGRVEVRIASAPESDR